MLTIGALAARAATTTRPVRQYRAVGVLPEPARSHNGYRSYDLRNAVALVRVRRLAGLGLALAEVRDALRHAGRGSTSGGQGGALDADDGLRTALTHLDADPARQEQAIHERRRRLTRLSQIGPPREPALGVHPRRTPHRTLDTRAGRAPIGLDARFCPGV